MGRAKIELLVEHGGPLHPHLLSLSLGLRNIMADPSLNRQRARFYSVSIVLHVRYVP